MVTVSPIELRSRQIRCGFSHVDFGGRSDGASVRSLLPVLHRFYPQSFDPQSMLHYA
jgi:hypothetical protein